ncbi:hypothetical protein RJ639_041037 [Escallonia herrerae]|uniref:Uncharacterized protein n=1 Tax=Escallonia herrerae TaxID=1293975 RepID=A0AA89B1J8_9ASTE|nr:hypothetical protein RJ639_041037 [Escallonia herrerae]
MPIKDDQCLKQRGKGSRRELISTRVLLTVEHPENERKPAEFSGIRMIAKPETVDKVCATVRNLRPTN